MLEVTERGEPIAFSFDDVLRYHGGHSPGGAAIAYKVLERALPELAPCERREIEIETAFGGPGAREVDELLVDEALAERQRDGVPAARQLPCEALEHAPAVGPLEPGVHAVAAVGHRARDELERVARAERDAVQEARLTVLKRALAERVMARPAAEVVELSER